MKEFKVILPKESYSILDFKQEGLPGVAVINKALKDFEPKEVFAWHLAIMLDFEDMIENGMPSKAEREIVDPFCDKLDSLIKGSDVNKPNAQFLVRITWNKTRKLIWRVFDPEITDSLLKQIIEKNESPRQFDYRMEHDLNWDLAKAYLNDY
jgi:Family of unknown function (DUF695)